jgi:8-oxo-dGTP diphosphatase
MLEPDAAQVRAAGGVVWRSGDDGEPRFAVIHRPRYDDWSLPKGKLDRGEDWQDAAVREVEEEIGARCECGQELGTISYRDHKERTKAVRYWLMEATGDDAFVPNDEVDEVRWMRGEKALGKLSYERDRDVLTEAIDRLGA